MTAWTLAAIAFSTALIILLCNGDPKRRRSARLPGAGQGTTARRLLVALLCVPGLAFALIGDAAAFLMWLGACAALGWLVAMGFNRDRRSR